MEKVSFNFLPGQSFILKDVTITIKAGFKYGFVGRSGSGKTTAIDLLLGLIGPPSQGVVLVDNMPTTSAPGKNTINNVGYVPQQIFLIDDTITSNIVFGDGIGCVDELAMNAATSQAHVDDFVLTEFPLGFDTKIGERGGNLSGGQRQRIGIARALYKKPKLLVLDEATSALDTITEAKVLNSILDNQNSQTLIVVAHSFKAVRRCDWIYLFDCGEVIASGTFNQLWDTQALFRELAGGQRD